MAVILTHDALLVLGGFALANKYYGLSIDASHLAVQQALLVYGDPAGSNPLHSKHRSAAS